MKKRILGVILAIAMVGTLAFLFLSGNSGNNPQQVQVNGENLTLVKGIIGSEKKSFFDDPKVKEVLAKNGLAVEVETSGSRSIATTADLSKYDFAFPSSSPAAQKIQDKAKVSKTYSPFYSPMAIATHKPVIDVLAANGIATQSPEGIWNINMEAYLKLVESGTKWKDLKGSEAYPSPRSVLLSSTNLAKSNSAAMYLSIASYVANGNNVISDPAQATAMDAKISKLFTAQGFTESSSDDPFQNYLSQGAGAVPMVMIYEAQFVGEKINSASRITDQMILAYPEPTVFSKHILIPMNPSGDKLGELLTSNPDLIKLEAEFGFRTNDVSVFNKVAKDNGLKVQENIINIAETPSYDLLESMINGITEASTTKGK